MAKPKEITPEENVIPQDEREFTCSHKGSHVIYLQRPIVERLDKNAPIIKQQALTVRLQNGVKFDPFVECGPKGKNKLFRNITPEAAHAKLIEKAEDRESPVVFWKDRPMGDEEKEFDRQLRTERKLRVDQEVENAKLRDLIASAGLKVPADL